MPALPRTTPFPSDVQPGRRLALAGGAALLAGSALGWSPAARAQGIPSAAPAELGLSPQRLSRIGDWLRSEVAARKIPGAVVMLLRRGKVAYV